MSSAGHGAGRRRVVVGDRRARLDESLGPPLPVHGVLRELGALASRDDGSDGAADEGGRDDDREALEVADVHRLERDDEGDHRRGDRRGGHAHLRGDHRDGQGP